jgi:hypothetical protein
MQEQGKRIRGNRISVVAVMFVMTALLLGPATSVFAAPANAGPNDGPDTSLEAWLSGARASVGEIWNGLWTSVGNWFAASDGDTDTGGDGGTDPGGGGGFIDPDGTFGG